MQEGEVLLPGRATASRLLTRCDRKQSWLRAAHPAVFPFLPLHRELPWGRWLLAVAG